MNDPLQITVPLTGVETEMPLLPEGDYDFQIVESAPAVNKKNTGYNWNMKLALTSPATSTTNTPIHPNFPVFVNNIALQPSEDSADKEAYKRSIADAIDGIFGTTKDNRPDFNKELWESAVGRNVRARITIEEWQGKHSNKVKRFVKQEVGA